MRFSDKYIGTGKTKQNNKTIKWNINRLGNTFTISGLPPFVWTALALVNDSPFHTLLDLVLAFRKVQASL